jgi:catechol 2,3-dioxygenase
MPRRFRARRPGLPLLRAIDAADVRGILVPGTPPKAGCALERCRARKNRPGRCLLRGLNMRRPRRVARDSGEGAGLWLTARGTSHDVALATQAPRAEGRVHRAGFARDSFREAGVFLETAPHTPAPRPTLSRGLDEPGGMRVEPAHAGARPIPTPGGKRDSWAQTARQQGQAWGLRTNRSFRTHGTPPPPEGVEP